MILSLSFKNEYSHITQLYLDLSNESNILNDASLKLILFQSRKKAKS